VSSEAGELDHIGDARLSQEQRGLARVPERGFVATLKKELIRRRSWPTRAELRTAVFGSIESFDNAQTALVRWGCSPPADYENSTLGRVGPRLAAPRLASINKDSEKTAQT